MGGIRSVRLRGVLLILFALAFVPGGGALAQAYERPGTTVLISRSLRVGQSVGDSGFGSASISGDGHYVAYASQDNTIVLPDTNPGSDIFVYDRVTGRNIVASVDSNGLQGTTIPSTPGNRETNLSLDGRTVAFTSSAPNLVVGDTNLADDVFVRDLHDGVTSRVSISSEGDEANGPSDDASVSADGRFVAFSSGATNLVPNDTNEGWDVFLRDLRRERTILISQGPEGTPARSAPSGPEGRLSFCPSINGSGRYVSFSSGASNLIEGDTNGLPDVFLYDRATRETEIVSVASDGSHIDGVAPGVGSGGDTCAAQGKAISASGRYVAFDSGASDLVPNDSGQNDVFVRDRVGGRTERVSVSGTGAQANGTSALGSISPDGRFVAFSSLAGNLVPDDRTTDLANAPFGAPSDADVFVHDRRTGTTESVSLGGSDGDLEIPLSEVCGSGGGDISQDGRYVAFQTCRSFSENDRNSGFDSYLRHRGPSIGTGEVRTVPAESEAEDGVLGGSVVHRAESGDLFVEILTDSMPRLIPGLRAGHPGLVYGIRFENEGARYEVRARGAAGRSTIMLFRCLHGNFCVPVSRLRGGFGTVGQSVVASVPTELIDSDSDVRPTGWEAFMAGDRAGQDAAEMRRTP
ncbi:MAG: hypothetical protein ACRDLB_04625 [Actinomycetota bacterium]